MPAPINKVSDIALIERNLVVWRILNRKRSLFAAHQTADIGSLRRIETADAMAAGGIIPDFTLPDAAVAHESLSNLRIPVEARERTILHLPNTLSKIRSTFFREDR